MKKIQAFKNFEKAASSFPQSGGPQRILVFNNQGLPILQYGKENGAIKEMNIHDSALGAELIREVFQSLKRLRDKNPSRVVFFFEDEVVSFEQDDPFIFLINWHIGAFKLSTSNETYIRRLGKTLQEELT